MNVLVFNAGSSSLKFALFDGDQVLASGKLDWSEDPARGGYGAGVNSILEDLRGKSLLKEELVIGHRVVHGGVKFRQSVVIDASVKAEIESLSELAPLHNPPALEVIQAAEQALPGRVHVAVFDTALYASLPPVQYLYPLPYEWYSDWGIRRFGFHGINHSYVLGRAAELLGRPPDKLNLISCHLGQGCSATAFQNGRAIATTMGFTPLDGLMMGRRPGSLDPGILPYVQRKHGLDAGKLEQVLNHESGLAGISGLSADLRALESAARDGHSRAKLALEMFALHVRSSIGAFAVTLGQFDALVFTGGIGEHSALTRAAVCAGLECLNAEVDLDKNGKVTNDQDIAASESKVRVLVVRAEEELMIAQEARRLSA